VIRREIVASMVVILAVFALAASRAPSFATAADAPPSAVTFFPAPQVAEAFGRGSVLYAGPKYMIHASRREGPGQAEVHVKDADIIHVLEGEAVLVTDGRVMGGRTTAPDEIRGASIEGGRTLMLSKGDVVVVPEGTPHWFKEIRGPFVYYVVKVR
jgi:glc operon protein GlcG